jgi:hypothetical protein
MIQAVITFPILLLGLYSMGEWIRTVLLGPESLSPSQTARALGFGILAHSLLIAIAGFTHVLTTPIAAILTALPFLIFIKICWRDLVQLFRNLRLKPTPSFHFIEILFLLLIATISLIRLFNALAPNISWDATSHHYLVASIWLRNGWLADIPSVIYSYYPSLNEMGIAGTMALGTDILSNLYGWLFGLLSMLLFIGIGMRHFSGDPIEIPGGARIRPGRFAGIAAAFLFALFPGNSVQTAGGWVDLALTCWTLLTIDMLFEMHHRSIWPALISAGLFSGAALATKHLAILPMLGFIIILAWMLYYEKETKSHLTKTPGRFIWAFIGLSLLIPLPWYIRSIAFTGNPLYPFAILGLPGPPLPPFTASSWVRLDYHRSLIGLFTYWPHLVFNSAVGQALGKNYSVAFLYAFPLAFMVRRLNSLGRLLAILSGFSILIIYVLFPVETRYHFAFIAAMAIVFGLLLEKLLDSGRTTTAGLTFIAFGVLPFFFYRLINGIRDAFSLVWVPLLASAAFLRIRWQYSYFLLPAFMVVLSLFSFVHDSTTDFDEIHRRYKVVLNIEPSDKYLARESARNYGMILHINNEMDWRHMKILALETRLYRLKADWVTWFGLKESKVPVTPAENVSVWYRGGFTHILLGDDVGLKPLIYYNVVHLNGWDVRGATPEQEIEYLKAHPDEDMIKFKLPDLWTNLEGKPFTSSARHFTQVWMPKQLIKERFKIENIDGKTWYTASRLAILTDPERVPQYAFVRGLRELMASGGLKVAFTDGLTYLLATDYPTYLKSHPDVDLKTLGLD